MAGTKLIKSLLDFLKLSGGTMTGDIDMGDNDIADVKSIAFNDGDATITEVKDEDDMAADSATMIATQQSIKAYVDATAAPTSNAYSTTLIKVMPTEFMINDDYSGRYANVIEDDTADTLGFRMGNVNTEGFAFVHVPNGYKATHCIVRASASTSNAVTCLTFNYTTGATASTSGDFDFNSIEDITDVVASTTNDLVIKISPANVATIIYGAGVTIAAV